MDILVFSPTPTFPTDQGNRLRVANLTQALQDRGATIHFAYFPREWGGRFSREEYLNMSRQWEFFDTVIPSKPFVYQTSEAHFRIDDWWDDSIGRFVNYKTSGQVFDACVVNYAFFSRVFDHIPESTVKILDTHDRLSNRREMLESNGVNPEFFYTSAEEENIALNRADIILAINEEEARYFRTQTDKAVVTLGHVCDVMPLKRKQAASDGVVRMGFLGSSNSVNVKNVNDFLQYLTEHVPEGLSKTEIHLYGSCCPRITVPQGCPVTVRLMGRVDTVDEFYENVDCAFVPFLFGTGQKIKLIEALSYQIPLIATDRASEGSGTNAPPHLLQSFADIVSEMKRFETDKSFRDELARHSVEQFARYKAAIDTTLDSVFELATSRSVAVTLDPDRLAKALKGKPRGDIVDVGVNMIAALDMMAIRAQLENKDLANYFVRKGIAQALGGELGAWPPAESVRTQSFCQVVFGGLGDQREASTRRAIVFHLPGLSHGHDPEFDPSTTLNVQVSPFEPIGPDRVERGVGTMSCWTPVNPHNHERDRRYEAIMMLAPDVNAPDLAEAVRKLRHEVRLRTGRDMPVHCVDANGRRGAWHNDGFQVDVENEVDVLDILVSARALALSTPHLGVAFGLSYMTAGALHRTLINDCGPLISMVEGNPVAVEDEIMARSLNEAAAWIAMFDKAVWTSNMFSSRRRSGVGALVSGITIALRLEQFLEDARSSFCQEQLEAAYAVEPGYEPPAVEDAGVGEEDGSDKVLAGASR